MAVVGDIFEIVDVQELLGQQCLNVYFYRAQGVSVTENDAQSMANAWIEHVLPTITPWQTSDVVHTAVRCRNLFDDTDAYEALMSEPGAGGSDTQSTFEAFPFRLVTDNAAVRPGAKRMAGVDGSYVTDGVVDNATLIGQLNDFATQLATEIAWGLLEAELGAPVVVARMLVDGRYELPTTQADAVFGYVTDALFNPRVTSQVSRKVGVGE